MSAGTVVLAVHEPDARELLQQSLEHVGYVVLVGRSITEVQQLAARSDAIVIDAGLPEQGSMRLLESDPPVPVLLILERADESVMQRYLQAGATDVICRPVLSPELHARLSTLVRMARAEHAAASERQDFDLLLDITRTLATATEPNDIMEKLVARLKDYLHVDRASIILVSRDPNYGYTVASSESDGVGLHLDLRKYPEVRRTLQSGKVLIVEDVATSQVLAPLRELLEKAQIKSLLALPIKPKDEVAATLLLHARGKTRKFSRQEVRLAAAAAEAAGFALRNARVFQTVRG